MTKRSFKTVTLILLTVSAILTAAVIAMLSIMISKGPKGDILGHRKQSLSDISPISPLPESADRGEFYIRNTIFFGDSVIAKMKDAKLLDESQVWCGEGGDIALDYNINKTAILYGESGMLMPVSEAAQKTKPARMIITIGIKNGVPYCSEESFKEYYRKLVKDIQKASPNTVIILQSVFPTSKKYQKNNSAITVEKIDLANRWISEIARDCGVKYLHTCTALKDKDGYLNSKYDSGDGLHLNAEGYKAVLNYIRTHGVK